MWLVFKTTTMVDLCGDLSPCRLEVPEDKVKAVYRTAMMLKMDRAAEACSRYLAEHLTPNNCLGKSALTISI